VTISERNFNKKLNAFFRFDIRVYAQTFDVLSLA
jgi:hypothetical protein